MGSQMNSEPSFEAPGEESIHPTATAPPPRPKRAQSSRAKRALKGMIPRELPSTPVPPPPVSFSPPSSAPERHGEWEEFAVETQAQASTEAVRPRKVSKSRVPHSQLHGQELLDRQVSEKLRRRRSRAKKRQRQAGASATQLEAGSGSFTALPLPHLTLHQGWPIGPSYTRVIRELSMITRMQIFCFTPVSKITDEQFQSVYIALSTRYAGGINLSALWVRRHTASLVQFRRTRVRAMCRKHLSPSAVPLPAQVRPEELAFFEAELSCPLFQAKSARMRDMAKAMIIKLGCGNVLGHGGIPRLVAQYIMKEGVPPSIELMEEWKSIAEEAYAQSHPHTGEPPAVDEDEVDDVINDEGADWGHPTRGPLLFRQRFETFLGFEATDADVAFWEKSGRPAFF